MSEHKPNDPWCDCKACHYMTTRQIRQAWERAVENYGDAIHRMRAELRNASDMLKGYAEADKFARGEGAGVFSDPDAHVRETLVGIATCLASTLPKPQIWINGVTHDMPAKFVTAADILKLANTDSRDCVEVVTSKGLIPLDSIGISGGEQFVTHPGDGASN